MSNTLLEKLEKLEVDKKYSIDFIESLIDEDINDKKGGSNLPDFSKLTLPIGLSILNTSKYNFESKKEQKGGFLNPNLLLETSMAIVPFLLIGLNDKEIPKEEPKEEPKKEEPKEEPSLLNMELPVKIPEVKIPEVKIPEVKIPEVDLSKINIPEVKLPEVKLPDVKLPDVKLSDIPNVLDC